VIGIAGTGDRHDRYAQYRERPSRAATATLFGVHNHEPGKSLLKRGDILIGKRGRYLISLLVGRGGVGAVFQAQAVATGDTVAVKVLHGERFPVTDVALERLRLEIEATLRVNSPFVVQGVDDGVHDGSPFLVMEWMPGGTLQQRIAEQTYDPPQAVRWIAQTLKGLLAVRGAGLVHRDLKPNNILLSRDGVAKLADLGIAKRIDDAFALTLSGDQMGSLLYISELQRQDPAKATAADDFYSLCCVFYELGSGRRIHTNNPRLRYLRPTLIPSELWHLIDAGMVQQEPWEEVFGEMTLAVNVDTEALDPKYDGGILAPSRRVAVMLKDLEGKHPEMLAAPVPVPDLLSALLSAVQTGAEDAARELVEHGLDIGFGPDPSDDNSLGFAVGLVEPLASKIERLGVLETFHERAGGGIVFEDRSPGYALNCIWGKRIDSDISEFLDESFVERVFTCIDDDARAALHLIGRAAALAIAIGAIDRIAELAHAKSADAESAESE
jgi:hypothetical protein